VGGVLPKSQTAGNKIELVPMTLALRPGRAARNHAVAPLDAADRPIISRLSFRAALRFDQERVCEAIIRHLEARESHPRADVCLRDQGSANAGADARVEMTFRLGGQLYALEHTGIEPFDGFIQMNNEADRFFVPLRERTRSHRGV
jgi:hypothetical protein